MTCPPLHIPNKEWSGDRRELENYVAIERWALCREEGCTCYVRHIEGTQTFDPPFGGAGQRVDLVEFDPANFTADNVCGTLSDTAAMLTMHLRWWWTTNSDDPFITDITGAGLASVSGRIIGVWAQGFDPSNGFNGPADGNLAIDTRLGLGTEWYYDGSVEGGSLSTPINIFPAGQAFTIWAGQSSDTALDLQIVADIYTVCACSCVL